MPEYDKKQIAKEEYQHFCSHCNEHFDYPIDKKIIVHEKCGSHVCVTRAQFPTWLSELKKIQQCPQRHDSTSDQLKDLRTIANKFGFYDAADFLDRL